jgi:predicted transcriptional regulator
MCDNTDWNPRRGEWEPKMLKEKSRKRRKTHRVNVNFSDDAYNTLKEIAHSRDKTISEVLRDAIALEQWYESTKQEGGRVIVELEDGRVREVVRP